MRAIIPVRLVKLGRLEYDKAFRVQEYFAGSLLKNINSQSTLLIVEHTPVYTLGLRESVDTKLQNDLRKLGADLVHSNRGGLTTFHGPGQLVAYPIFHLKHFKLSLRKYVSKLEHVAVHTCRMLGVNAKTDNSSVSHTGAWANNNKICAIGVNCKRYVTSHGLALNCNVDLDWFNHITPCGIKDKGVTSLTQELSQTTTVDQVLPQFLTSFEAIFDCAIDEDEEAPFPLLIPYVALSSIIR